MRIILPIPPSVNHIWERRGKTTYLAASYKRWLTTFQECVFEQRIKPADDRIRVNMTVIPGRGWRGGRDLDNIIKPTLDAMKRTRIIEDDNCDIVRAVSICMGRGDGEPARLVVDVERVE